MLSNPFGNNYYKLLILLALCLFFGGIFLFTGRALIPVFFDISTAEIADIYKYPSLYKGPLKLIQLFNGIGLFIVPAILYILLFEKTLIKSSILIPTPISSLVLIVLIFFSSFPSIAQLAKWNEAIEFPELFASIENWMKEAEAKAADLTVALLQMENRLELLFNLILIAVIPAVGEELIFRGIIQNTINKGLRNKHIGVWVAAILFSAIHLQFYGFLPRMFLGALFGYLLLWSRNLWVPIFAHFINNGFAVISSYMTNTETLKRKLNHEDFGQSLLSILLSLIFFFFLLFVFWKSHNNKTSSRLNR